MDRIFWMSHVEACQQQKQPVWSARDQGHTITCSEGWCVVLQITKLDNRASYSSMTLSTWNAILKLFFTPSLDIMTNFPPVTSTWRRYTQPWFPRRYRAICSRTGKVQKIFVHPCHQILQHLIIICGGALKGAVYRDIMSNIPPAEM